MARVAMLRFWSEMRLSMSMLQLVTAMGWLMATLFNVRTAANLHTHSHDTTTPSHKPLLQVMAAAMPSRDEGPMIGTHSAEAELTSDLLNTT